MSVKHLFFGTIATVALISGGARPSDAALMISLSDNNGNSTTITDQGVGDLNPLLGGVTFIGSVGNFLLNVTTGTSKPLIGSAAFPAIDLSSVDVTSLSGGGTLTLNLTDTGFTGTGNPVAFVSQIGGAQGVGGTLSYKTFLDCGNTAFGTSTPLSTQNFSTTPFAGARITNTTLCSSTYSLTEQVVLSLGPSEATSFNANLAVPEPATLTLFGVGLLAFGWLSRRKATN